MSGIADPFDPAFRMRAMSALLARNWWAIALRGVIAIIFGLCALFLTIPTIGSLVLLFAIYLLVDGVLAIAAGVRAAAHHERWGMLLLEGVVDIAAGIVAFAFPGLTIYVLVAIAGVWGVVSGFAMAFAAARLHPEHGRIWLVLSGLVSIVWGILLFLFPITGAIVMTWWLGAYALVFGAFLLVLAFRLRHRHMQRQLQGPAAPSELPP